MKVDNTEVEKLVLPQLKDIEGLLYAGQIDLKSKTSECGSD